MMTQHIIQSGKNCWKLAKAKRSAFLVDGESYFSAVRTAILGAERVVFILGWDVHSRTDLAPGGANDSLPHELAEFLRAVLKRQRHLHIYVLTWDFAMIYATEREWVPVYRPDWLFHRRFHFQMDSCHPVAASQHQKIVVVDDRLAFVGGFDLTQQRWDTSAHDPNDGRRRDPEGKPYPPFHDVQMMVDGEAARKIGFLARQRWQWATGKWIAEVDKDTPDPWPSHVAPDSKNCQVAIARTLPRYQEREEAQEVKQLYLDAIAAAKHWIYIENQYLTSGTIGNALAKRLQEPYGPEVVLVLPLRTGAWLEQHTMDVLRARLLRRLREADQYHRFRVYYPHQPGLGEDCINVHAKILVVDALFAMVGSANLSSRSMGLDSECNLALERSDDETALSGAIANLRNRLLAEHLHVPMEVFAEAFSRQDSLIGVIEHFVGKGRTLKPLRGEVPEEIEQLVPEGALLDPETPIDPDRLVQTLVEEPDRRSLRRTLVYRGVPLMSLLGLAAAWQWTPLSEWLEPEKLAAWAQGLAATPWGGVVAVMGFLLGSLIAAPVSVLIIVTALIFGPFMGFVYALVGALGAALVTYAIGYAVGRETVRHWAGQRINRLSERLSKHGLLTVIFFRVVPLAPFTVVNLVAGASHIKIRDYLIGSVVGMVPGIFAMVFFVDGLIAALRDPGVASFTLVILLGLLLLGIAAFAWRWLQREKAKKEREN